MYKKNLKGLFYNERENWTIIYDIKYMYEKKKNFLFFIDDKTDKLIN